MLELYDVVKEYRVGEETVAALKGISTAFRQNEFVSILGPSGCGKTTLLNLIGGLDQYTKGDLVINGTSTKRFSSRDWDTYRNHSVGFVFQSYNLIPHQSVLANVELSLTLTGVSRAERRSRATEVLKRVGLGDQLHKKPNQMSGGQMQRVAIARALINNPDILLADEPTGALDSETSVQIMELLKEIAHDKLVIMVTHNPELAETYSTRIIRLLDGKIVDDSHPFVPETAPAVKPEKRKKRKPSMSFFTALSLSLNNLMTKKARTLMTSFAGSIGIIGIALILALSTGVRQYINKVEEDTLSSYPLSIEETSVDVNDMITSIMGKAENTDRLDSDKIYTNNIMTGMIETTLAGMTTNNLKDFKAYLEESDNPIAALCNAIQYRYATTMNIYRADTTDGIYQVNPSQVFDKMGMPTTQTNESSPLAASPTMGMMESGVWQELLDNEELLNSQYEIIAGRAPSRYDEVVLMVNEKNEISDYTAYALGMKDAADLKELFIAASKGEEIPTQPVSSYGYDELLGLRYKLLLNTDYFTKDKNGTWTDRSKDNMYLLSKLNDAIELKVVGILRPAEGAKVMDTAGVIGYRAELMEELINRVNDSEIVKAQQADKETDVFTNLPFANEDDVPTYTMKDIMAYIAALPPAEQAQYTASIQQMQAQGMPEAEIVKLFAKQMNPTSSATYDGNLMRLGVVSLDAPSGIDLYPKDFAAKEGISEHIKAYNNRVEEANQITYTDYIGLMMSSVTTIIEAISIILMAFVAISLVVSSIMIGIITYISVLERTKEIGILRAMGASKRDISRVFNAETLIVGFTSGAFGIAITLLLVMLANAIIYPLTDIPTVAVLPVGGAVILVIVSMVLTFIAGLIPSRVAANKDPVEALRSE